MKVLIALKRILAESVFTQADLKKLRKDVLTLIRAAEKETSYNEVRQVNDAINEYMRYLDDLFYKRMAPLIKNEVANQAFREATWKLYIDLGLPTLHDDHWSKEYAYRRWQDKKKTYLNKARRSARLAIKAINEYFLKELEETPITEDTTHTVSYNGFRVIVEDPPRNAKVFREALKIAQTGLNKVFPEIMKRKPIIKVIRIDKLDAGAEYDHYERKVVMNSWSFRKDPKESARYIVHELGHDLWYHYISDNAKTYWHNAVKQDWEDFKLSDLIALWPEDMVDKSLYAVGESLVEIDPKLALNIQTLTHYKNIFFKNRADAIDQMQDKGDVVFRLPRNPITPYANKNYEEAFCEAFSTYTVYGPKAVLPIVRMWLSNIIPRAKIITALKRIIRAGLPTATIPKGAKLFHGSLAKFSGALRPGGDGMIWFADEPQIAQLYLPKAGITMYPSDESLIRPTKEKMIQAIQKLIGIEYDLDKVEWDNTNRPTSYSSPKGWSKFPKVKDVAERMEKLGFEKDHNDNYKVRFSGIDKVLKPGEAEKGRLFIATVKEPLTIWLKAKGEGDLTDLQYHDLKGFQIAEDQGLDGVLIDDFAQSEEHGNFGHKSVGLFDTKKLSIRSIPAQYREWEYGAKGTEEYPNAPVPFFNKLLKES